MTTEELEKYSGQLLVDMNLGHLQGEERQKTLDMLSGRFQEVVFNTTVRVLPESRREEYIKAAMDPEKNEAKIIELTSQTEGLPEAIEAALLYEYESLKRSMKKS